MAQSGRTELLIQVTRPAYLHDQVWQMIGRGKTAQTEHSAAEAAAEIKSAIEKKAKQTPLGRRKVLTLAIDVIETPEAVLESVRETFDVLAGMWLRELGFQAVWLVGPTSSTTIRLDR